MITKTNADIAKALKGFYDTNIQALQGIMDKLPEALRGDLKKIYDDLNTQLAKLPPLEQVPLANEAAGSLNYLADCVVRMQEYSTRMLENITNLSRTVSEKTAAYQGLDDKIKTGELVTKDAATELARKAREDGVLSVMPAIVASRKQQVEMAGLPDPGKDVLELEAEQFNTRFSAAKDQLTKLGAKGLNLKARLVQELCWAPTAEFDGKLASFVEIIGGAKETKAAGGAADPLLGSGGTPGAKTEKPNLLAMA
jgi:hypothetical protein